MYIATHSNFDILDYDYQEDISYYNIDYLRFGLNFIMPISIVVIISIISIDHILNGKRFDLLFCTKITPKGLLIIKYKVYILLSVIYMSIIWCMLVITGLLRLNYFYLNQSLIQLLIMLNFIGILVVVMSLLAIRITKIGYSSIIVFIVYYVSRIISDINMYIGNLIFLNVDLNNKIAPLGLLPSFGIVVLYSCVLIFVFGKKELKLKNN